MRFQSLKSLFTIPKSKAKGLQPFSGVATVFIFNLIGIELPEGIDPATVVTEMNAVSAPVHRNIKAADGLIVSLVGDAVLAVWPSASLTPSHAELALACAKKILQCSREIQTKNRCSFTVRIILATGTITVTPIGGRFQVYGAPMAVAKRLEELGIPKRSGILCTSETLSLVPAGMPVESVGQVKGTTGDNVAVFEFA